ncbi:MAG: Rpn family recombination-promoting nuclease/putative transposase [Cyanobacteria bacterium SBLK]|nr:Rpn family recombination-promoting nuclease/putative transposase [Cyanobacteria bacterium SBLK]
MNFIDPKTDLAFKRIFGSPKSQDILLSFLNALLYEGEPIVESVEIVDFNERSLVAEENHPLTLKAVLNGEHKCIFDLQYLSLKTLGKRVLYHAAKSYSQQLFDKRERRPEIKPLMAIYVTDFIMFEEIDTPISKFTFKEIETNFSYPNGELGLFFVELPKFNKEIETLETSSDRWIYFLKNASILETIPEGLSAIPEIQQAFTLADVDSLTREEFALVQQQLLAISDRQNAIALGKNEGIEEGVERGRQEGIQTGIQQGKEAGIQEGIQQGKEEGIQEGIQQGRQQGIKQGRQEGIQFGKLTIILRLLNRRFKLDAAIQESIKSLSNEQLDRLAEAAWDFITDSELEEWLEKQAEKE